MTSNAKSSRWLACSAMAPAPWDVLAGGQFQSKKAIEERKARGEGLRPLTNARGHQNEVEAAYSEGRCTK